MSLNSLFMNKGDCHAASKNICLLFKYGVIMKKNSIIKKSIIVVFAVLITAEAFASRFIIEPSSTQSQTQSISIPLTLNNELSEDILSIELQIGYDPNVLTATGLSLNGSVLDNQDYLYVSNTNIPGTIYAIFASSTDIHNASGLLLNLDFIVTGSAGETSDISIVSARFNNDEATALDGIFTVADNHYVISGHVSSHTDIPNRHLQNVVMTLSGTYSYSTITDASGNYAFTSVPPGSYTLTASKTDDISLDLADAIKILKGAVKLINLNCYEQIAADAYIDGYFGAFDASKVAHYVSGLGNCLNNDCLFWLFIPEEINNCETWPLIEIEHSRHFNDLNGDVSGQDFIGIGCGDVSQ